MRKRKPHSTKKYFWKDIYVGTVPASQQELKHAVAYAVGTDLRMLDQPTVTQETFVNALFIWAADLARARGAAGIEAELRPAFSRLSTIVADDMKQQAALKDVDGGGTKPDGFSTPDPGPAPVPEDPPDAKPRTGRRRAR